MAKKVTIEGKRPATATLYKLLELRKSVNPTTGKKWTQEDIGKLWNVTRSRVSQLEGQAKKLRGEGKLVVEAGG